MRLQTENRETAVSEPKILKSCLYKALIKTNLESQAAMP